MLNPTQSTTYRRRYLLAGGVVALVGTLAYQAYQNDAYGRSKRYLAKLKAALEQYTDALTTGGEITASILRDLQHFLNSEGNEVPPSLRQVSKLIQSQEFTATASSTVAAIYQGVAGASTSTNSEHPQQPQQGTVDKILDALLSDRGHSLVSVAVSMGAKNMVSSYVEATSRAATHERLNGDAPQEQQPDTTDKLFTFLSSSEGQQLAVMAVAAFASNGMRVYMDKSLEVNFYEDLFSSMSKPQHLEAVKQCVGVFARDVVAVYLQGGLSRPASGATLQEIGENNNNAEDDGGGGVSGGGRRRVEVEIEEEEISTASAAVSVAAESPTNNTSGSGNNTREGGGDTTVSTAPAVPASSSIISFSKAEGEESGQPNHHHRHDHLLVDDLDSDSLLHARKKKGGKERKQANNNAQWIAAVGKEWLHVSKDADGRQAMAVLVGSATREVVSGVSSAMLERFSSALLLIVLLTGVVMAVVVQRLGAILLH